MGKGVASHCPHRIAAATEIEDEGERERVIAALVDSRDM